jgi:hypothetical protein
MVRMHMRWIFVIVAASALSSFSMMTDASAGQRGGRAQPLTGKQIMGGKQVKPPSNYFNAKTSPNNGGNFAVSGPFSGAKWIGNVP